MPFHPILLVIVALFVISACGGGKVKPDGSSKASQRQILNTAKQIEQEKLLNLPHITIGDTYVFNNPVVAWEAVDVKNKRITWVSNHGARIVTSSNPLLPSFEWISEGDGEGKRLISDVTGGLFPLKIGNEMSFRSTVSLKGQKAQWNFTWECAILGEAEIEIPAGNFNTFKITCARDGTDVITYYFAPTLGYYVRMETGGKKGALLKQRDLLSYNNFTGASLQVAQNLKINDQVDAGLQDENAAPVLPLPIDNITPNPQANLAARNLLRKNLPQRKGTETILPVPTELNPIEPSGEIGLKKQPEKPPQSLAKAPAPDYQENSATILTGQTIAVHLASYNTQNTAERGWRILSSEHPELTGKNPRIILTNLGAIGIFYRLYAAPFANLDIAADLCDRLKNKGLYCQVSEI